MPHERAEIDVSRRNFIKLSLALIGIFILTKIYGLFSRASRIRSVAAANYIGQSYVNTRYGFSLWYPSDLAVSTFDEGNGASTVTFQNVETARGFQIFITPKSEPYAGEVPYNGMNGTEEIESSGARAARAPITIDGAPGTAFYSTRTALGATREMRIAHGDFLYEVTTPKPLDARLGEIMTTWQFV